MEKLTKQLKEALKAELTPHIIGLRNEIKKLISVIRESHKEDVEDIREVRISNPEPSVKRVEVTNKEEELDALKSVEIAIDEQTEKTESQFINFGSYLKSLGFGISKLVKFLTEDADKTKNVSVENLEEIEFPTEMKITNFPPQEKQNDRMFITNSTPQDAIPVVLTSADRKKFYSVMTALFGSGGGGGIPSGMLKLLQEIADNTDELELKTDTVNVNLGDLEQLNGSITRDDFGEVSVATATETTIASLTVPSGKTYLFKGGSGFMDADCNFRLFLNSNKKWENQNAWTDRNVKISAEFIATSGDVITLKAEHSRGTDHTVFANIYAYEI